MLNNSNLTRSDFENAFRKIFGSFSNFIDRDLLDDKRLPEFEKYFASGELRACGWNIEKVKILFELLKLRDSSDAEKILSYIVNPRF
jgi:hypothetical protein